MRSLLERKPVKLVFFSALSLLIVEVLFRVGACFLVGPTALLYGTGLQSDLERLQTWDRLARKDEPDKVEVHGEAGSYGRFAPHQEKTMPLPGGGLLRIGINNHGFRDDDFEIEKPPGVVRVIALGASSTFGFYVQDHETYPAYLERILNRTLEKRPIDGIERVEVLNLGIPHLHSDEIHALFEHEGIRYDPDFVTFYEGVNDTRRLRRGAHERAFVALADHLMVLRYVVESLWRRYETFDAEDVDHHRQGKAEFFVEQVDAIRRTCAAHGARFLPMTQQSASLSIGRNDLAGVSYTDERRRIQDEMSGGRIDGYKMAFLLHGHLMDALRDWSDEEGVRLVDIVKLFDDAGRRDCLLTWVHLSPEGNRMLAAELAEHILDELRAR